jgi:hypothetical protein
MGGQGAFRFPGQAVQTGLNTQMRSAVAAGGPGPASGLAGIDAMQKIPRSLAPQFLDRCGAGQFQNFPGAVDQPAVGIENHDQGMGLIKNFRKVLTV